MYGKFAITSLILFLTTTGFYSCKKENAKLPNIIIIFTDDQGYADVGVFGAKGFETPNIDKLASEGMRFTDFYVSEAVCSASRSSLLTGCYAKRISIFGALMPWTPYGLNPGETTIADMLKQKGYVTGMVGKWHLGAQKEFLPLNNGFDEYFGLPYSNDMWPVDFDGKPAGPKSTRPWKASYPPLTLFEGTDSIGVIKTLSDQATLTTRYTERAIRFIEEHSSEHFFLYLAHSMPHVPLGVSDKYRGKSKQGMYGDVIEEVDWSVGEIMKTLRRLHIDGNTLVIYTSDNGPWLNFGNHAGSAFPFREGKGTAFEGGVREPTIMRWKGQIPQGTVCNKMASTLDILPTLAAITGAPLPDKTIDGVNILPLLKGNMDTAIRDEFFYYYTGELRAVRKGKWKLFFPHKSRSYNGVKPGKDGFPGKTKTINVGLELYNLENDSCEKNDVAGQYPGIVDSLTKIAEKMRLRLGDRLTNTKGIEVRPHGRLFSERMKKINNLATGKKIILKLPYSNKYPGGGNNTLIDGYRGSLDFSDGQWQGYKGEGPDAIIDFGKTVSFNKITVSFLNSQFSWIFLPAKVDFLTSLDGHSFKTIKSFVTEQKKDYNQYIKEYVFDSATVNTRYLEIKATGIGTIPQWHHGRGNKPWIFTDEIVIE